MYVLKQPWCDGLPHRRASTKLGNMRRKTGDMQCRDKGLCVLDSVLGELAVRH